ncbi:MAG: response regulator [Dehalococcoidia bacterium]
MNAASCTTQTIVVADDEQSLLQILSRMLSRSGFHVVTALNGRQAMDKVKALHPSVLLTDMFMPEMNGAELCQSLKSKQETKGTAIIMMSSAPRLDIPECGADRFLAKPFALDALLHEIQSLTDEADHLSTNGTDATGGGT